MCVPSLLLPVYRGLSTYTPSLALLSEQLLGQPLRGRTLAAPVSSSQQQPQHDSREDASVSLALVKRELQQGTPSPPLETPDLKVRCTMLQRLREQLQLPGARMMFVLIWGLVPLVVQQQCPAC